MVKFGKERMGEVDNWCLRWLKAFSADGVQQNFRLPFVSSCSGPAISAKLRTHLR